MFIVAATDGATISHFTGFEWHRSRRHPLRMKPLSNVHRYMTKPKFPRNDTPAGNLSRDQPTSYAYLALLSTQHSVALFISRREHILPRMLCASTKTCAAALRCFSGGGRLTRSQQSREHYSDDWGTLVGKVWSTHYTKKIESKGR